MARALVFAFPPPAARPVLQNCSGERSSAKLAAFEQGRLGHGDRPQGLAAVRSQSSQALLPRTKRQLLPSGAKGDFAAAFPRPRTHATAGSFAHLPDAAPSRPSSRGYAFAVGRQAQAGHRPLVPGEPPAGSTGSCRCGQTIALSCPPEITCGILPPGTSRLEERAALVRQVAALVLVELGMLMDGGTGRRRRRP